MPFTAIGGMNQRMGGAVQLHQKGGQLSREQGIVPVLRLSVVPDMLLPRLLL